MSAIRRLVRIVAVLTVLGIGASPAMADIGYQDGSTSGTSTPTGSKRSESVLWFNDGSWWADMWDTSSADVHIFRPDASTHAWVDTGVPVDTRANTHADVLWDGPTHLYVTSHTFVPDEQAAVSGTLSYLYRFSYDARARRYSLADQQHEDRDASHRQGLDGRAVGDLAAEQPGLREPDDRRRRHVGHALRHARLLGP